MRACFTFPLSMLMMSINYTSSSCELNNPPKTSPKCIRNSTVHYEVLAMCFIKRTHLNLSTNSQGERGECCCCCCCHLRKLCGLWCVQITFLHLASLESTQEAQATLTLLSCSPNFPACSVSRNMHADACPYYC